MFPGMATDPDTRLYDAVTKAAEGKVLPVGYRGRKPQLKREAQEVLRITAEKDNWTDRQFIDLIQKVWSRVLEEHRDVIPEEVIKDFNMRLETQSGFETLRNKYTATSNKGFDKYVRHSTYTNLLWAWIWMVPIGALPPGSMKGDTRTNLAFRDFVATANGLQPILEQKTAAEKRTATQTPTSEPKRARSNPTSHGETPLFSPDTMLPSIELDETPVKNETTPLDRNRIETEVRHATLELDLADPKDCKARIEEWRCDMLRVVRDLSGGQLVTQDVQPARFEDPDEIAVMEGDTLSMVQYLLRHFENRMEQQRYEFETSIRETRLCNNAALDTIINQAAQHMTTLVGAIASQEHKKSSSLKTHPSHTTMNHALREVITTRESKHKDLDLQGEPVKSLFGPWPQNENN